MFEKLKEIWAEMGKKFERPKNTPYDQGRRDWPSTENPFPPGTQANADWQKGRDFEEFDLKQW
jgi:hypothetical protein